MIIVGLATWRVVGAGNGGASADDPGPVHVHALGLNPADEALFIAVVRDLTEINATDEWELPVPGTFVVDRGGVIRLAHVDADYTRRLEPDELLAAVRSL